MAIKYKALIGFSRLKDEELMLLTNTVISAMTGNAHFTNPTPPLADVQGLLDDFTLKLFAARRRGSPEETALKDESRKPLVSALQKLAYYVNMIADGQLSILLSSGFSTNQKYANVLPPLKVSGVRVSDGRQSGQVRLDFAMQKQVLLYEYQYKQEQEELWSDRYTTSSSRANIIAPLDIAVRYAFRVRAINSQGVGDWSDVSTILAR